ncbi:hypothetical protein B0H67DRAFT_495164 [Lasiosphaeris hirsuta]|uniref:CID domain-containing protein n=1 Tax=Lasiosphaeris hirsuta TaxID=260670 RepID=A0AA40DNM2_9PEZI|nr:hypothetical protein B0H67DRAFT_495164 [Lasiosphaeris hirsuta]
MSSSNKKIAEFPDVEAKLQKPGKQSAFERQKAEAEAKRRREAAETAAVYEDFVKSFDHDDSSPAYSRPTPSRFGSGQERAPFGNPGPFGGGAGKRHFGAPSGTPSGTPIKSGPGSLGPPPSSFGKRRPYDDFKPGYNRESDDGRGRLAFEDRESGSLSVSKAFDASDEEEEAVATTDRAEEKAISKPTLRLANLPPGTSPAFIKALILTTLTVENVKIVPPSRPGGTERKSIAAIVTLSKETPATDIDAAVSALQNRYLGFGFFLSLHRHLSSAAIASGLTTLPSTTAVAHPFGAKRVEEPIGSQAPQSTGYGGRGYAPPTSYGPPMGGPIGRGGLLHVPVRPPRDIKKLRMIHKVIESVLEHGPEFEALLMSRPDVQRDEKWAWIWDARSEGGIWYRWRLWEIVTGSRSKAKYIPLFEGSHAWKMPEQPLAYEYTTGVDGFVSDSEYNSSDEEDFEDEQARQAEPGGGINEQEDTFLNPIEKAKLVHLLARFPTTLSKIRKGDIARVTTFAITHASRGADEIVDLIVSNVELPFAYTSANPDYRHGAKEKDGQDEDSRGVSPAADDKTAADAPDTSAARLLGLYVVSDILSSSSTSGIRHAWRYRQLFETALRNRKTFELLGSMSDKLNWGRLRADKWKRSVGLVLNLWEGWCVFPLAAHAFFVSSFENPPVLKKEANGRGETEKKAGRWKPVEASAAEGGNKGSGFLPVSEQPVTAQSELVDGPDYLDMLETGDTDGEPRSPRLQYSSGVEELFSDDDLDGKPDEDFRVLEGRPADGDTAMGGLGETVEDTPSADKKEIKSIAGFQMSAIKPAPSRKRMRAVDMFAGSESEGEA